MTRAAVVVFTVSMAVSACGGFTQRVEPLDDSVRIYNSGVRWQKFLEAAQRLPPDQRDDFLDERDQLSDDLRVDDYEVIRIRASKDNRQAKVQVKYTWHLDSRGVVHSTHAVQSWERLGKIWVMVSETHMRGDSMPGVPEDSLDGDSEAEPGDGSAAESEGVDQDADADDLPDDLGT